jgi:hypothetical protein
MVTRSTPPLAMQVHTVENQSPVKLLVMRIVEKGKPATVQIP